MSNLNEVEKKILSDISRNRDFFAHRNLIIIGENKIGKTTLVKQLLDDVIKQEKKEFYYIDAMNRSVYGNMKNYVTCEYNDFKAFDILKDRCEKTVNTSADIFALNNTKSGGNISFSELAQNSENKYDKLFEEYLGMSICVNEEESDIKNQAQTVPQIFVKKMNDMERGEYRIEEISNSENAIMRMTMEIEFAKTNGCKVVIIEEFDSHLTDVSMSRYIEQLINNYKDMRFIVVIHTYSALIEIKNMDIINVESCPGDDRFYYLFDSNDINELGTIDRLKNRYLRYTSSNEPLLNQVITYIVNDKKVPEELQLKIAEMDVSLLTSKEKILFRYIEKSGANEI